MAVIQMSERELTRLRVLIDLSDDRLRLRLRARCWVWDAARFIVCAMRLPLKVQPL